MKNIESIKCTIADETDLINVRQAVRKLSSDIGFNLVDQTRLLTALSELCRNCLVHGGGGVVFICVLLEKKTGIQMIVCDNGPGIEDPDLALKDGYTTNQGLGGIGLGGCKRLLDDLTIETHPGKGTQVTGIKYKSY